MVAALPFIVRPVALIADAWRIRPLVSGGMFGAHGLEPAPVSVREDTERSRSLKGQRLDVEPWGISSAPGRH